MPFSFLGFPLFLLFGEGNSYMYVCMYPIACEGGREQCRLIQVEMRMSE